MSNYKISVIIPVYNAQDTIERSINSVINQIIGFSNIELILYDDNSRDNTRNILEEYSEKYDNIVLILSDENSGYPGKGRNTGIEIASADYVMFMDNDDEYCPNMCETLYNEIIKEDADIVSCNYLNIDEISSEIIYNSVREIKSSGNNKKIFQNDEVYYFQDNMVWSKIYKKSTIIDNNMKFPENKIWEDIYFLFLFLAYANKIVYLENYVGYLRHVQDESISKTMTSDKVKEIIDICYEMYSFYKNNDDVDFSWLLSNHFTVIFICIYTSNMLNNKNQIHDLLNHVYNFEKAINFDDSYLNIVYKIPNKLIMRKKFKSTIFI